MKSRRFFMNRISRIAVVGLLALGIWGCATVHIECPTDGSTTTVAVGGSTVGQQLLTLGLAAAKTAGFAQRTPGAMTTPPAPASTVDYKWVPIFGSDYASCAGSVPPPVAPPQVIMVPAGMTAQILK
jgi:hypothetical protein